MPVNRTSVAVTQVAHALLRAAATLVSLPRDREKTARVSIPLLLLAAGLTLTAHADPQLPTMLEGVGVDEKIGRTIDLDLTFIGENGYPVALRQFFHPGRPVILNLVYYKCPMLCNLVLNGQTTSLREIPWTPGDQFEVVTISIDPTEGFDLAQQKKATTLGSYGKPAPGWHFLVDTENHAKRLAESVGFHYRYDDKIEQYAHAAAIMLLTPSGKMARYLYGIRFSPRDLRLALTEASEGRGKFSIERLLLFCYHYDPSSRSYTLFATNVMRGGGILTMLILGSILIGFWKKERRKSLGETLVLAK